MYPTGKHPIFPHSKEDREEAIKLSGFDENIVEEDVDRIEDWLNKQPHLADVGIDRRMILLYLYGNKGSVEKTKKKIDMYCRHRYYAPEIIHDRIPLLTKNDKIWSSFILAPMPKMYKGQRITISRAIDIDELRTVDIFLRTLMMADIRAVNDFVVSDIWVFDYNGFELQHAIKTDWSLIQKINKLTHEGTSFRVSAIHILNFRPNSITTFFLNMLKQVLSHKMFNRVMFHDTFDDLHKEIPKEYLPSDYGGTLPFTTLDIRDKFEEVTQSEDTKQFLIDCCKMVSDESKRPKDEYSDELMTGTFKQLNFD